MDLDISTARATDNRLSPWRLRLLRGAYLFVGLGLVVARWPLVPELHQAPRFEGTTVAMLTAMSVLALVGAWRPVRMLPILLFESLWKGLWLVVVALPAALGPGLDAGQSETLVNCLFVVPVLLVLPWGLVWDTYVRRPGERPHDHATA